MVGCSSAELVPTRGDPLAADHLQGPVGSTIGEPEEQARSAAQYDGVGLGALGACRAWAVEVDPPFERSIGRMKVHGAVESLGLLAGQEAREEQPSTRRCRRCGGPGRRRPIRGSAAPADPTWFPRRRAGPNDTVLDTQRALLDGLGTWSGWQRWVDALVEFQERRGGRGGCPIANLVGQLGERDDDIRVVLASGFDRWEAHIRAGLTAMVVSGELRPDADVGWLAASTLVASATARSRSVLSSK